jgi:hypothetical protein
MIITSKTVDGNANQVGECQRTERGNAHQQHDQPEIAALLTQIAPQPGEGGAGILRAFDPLRDAHATLLRRKTDFRAGL